MAVPSNTRQVHSAIGVREDLANIIHDISPTSTPFLTGCGRESADNVLFEWQTDTLAAAATNRHTEGDDSTAAAIVETTRLTNYQQISKETVQISGTSEQVDFAGKAKSEMSYHLARASQTLKRDMEKMLTSNVAKSAGSSSTARITAGLPSWVASNYHSLGTSSVGTASTGNGTDTATAAGSAGAITEAGIKTVIRECFDNGGEPDTIMVGAFNKQAISDLTQSVSSLRTSADKVAPAHVVASVDIYVSDFGTMKIIPNRFSGAGDCWFLDFDFWSVSYLRDFKTEDLAKTGDSQKKHILVEYGLKSKNQKASGYLADLTTS